MTATIHNMETTLKAAIAQNKVNRFNDDHVSFEKADLRETNLSGANLSGTKLRETDLSEANLRGADLSWANLREANLSWADLSGAKNLPNQISFLEDNFEFEPDGSLIAYKTFNTQYNAPGHWSISQGSILSENCNPCRVSDCASGINVAKRDWNDFGHGDLWKVRIRPQWLASVVVPYSTNGKIRCERIELIEIVSA